MVKIYCPSCGAELDYDDMDCVCYVCGFDFESEHRDIEIRAIKFFRIIYFLILYLGYVYTWGVSTIRQCVVDRSMSASIGLENFIAFMLCHIWINGILRNKNKETGYMKYTINGMIQFLVLFIIFMIWHANVPMWFSIPFPTPVFLISMVVFYMIMGYINIGFYDIIQYDRCYYKIDRWLDIFRTENGRYNAQHGRYARGQDVMIYLVIGVTSIIASRIILSATGFLP